MNYLITGSSGVGKTTLLKDLAELLGDRAGGFLTIEVRDGGIRVGFDIHSFDGHSGVLARAGLQSRYHVGRYGVDIDSFERIAIPALKPISNKILIIDEIGKMELHSDRFRDALLFALDSECIVFAAIMQSKHPFADSIKSRSDSKIFELTRANRDTLLERLHELCIE